MNITIVQTGDVPAPLRDRFEPYPDMFRRMFADAGHHFDYDVVRAHDGAPLPDPTRLDGILITGSAAGVYDDLLWLDPLRAFIRKAFSRRTPMLGICFGHQIMADALGGEVKKSEKGWGLGRHVYGVTRHFPFLDGAIAEFAIVCSHQDQVIVPPAGAEVFLASEFTPSAGIVYENGAAISLQPHPEFSDDYALALAELRRGKAPDAVIEAAIASVARPSDSRAIARAVASIFSR